MDYALWLKPHPRLPAGAASNSMAAGRRAASRDGPAKRRENVGEPERWIGVVEFAGLDRRGDRHRPVPFGVRAGERPITPANGGAAHGVFGGGGGATDAAVVAEPDDDGPALQALLIQS